MNIGDNTIAGTGIYIGNGGDRNKASEVTIDSGADIKLNGINGVGAIVTTNATVDFKSGAKKLNLEEMELVSLPKREDILLIMVEH